MKICIFTNPEKTAKEIKESIQQIAVKIGFQIDDKNPDVVFAVGGDGTLLRSIHHFYENLNDISFCGANFGCLGFFYDYDKDEVEVALKNIFENKYIATKHYLVHGCGYLHDKIIKDFFAVNEIRIENYSKPIACDVYINDQLFEKYIGTGLTVSSTIGSSAYNMTLSGSVVSHDIHTLQLTSIQPSPFCKHLPSSLVMGIDNKITIVGEIQDVLLGYDHVVLEHCKFDKVLIENMPKMFTLLRKSDQTNVSKFFKLFN